MAAAAITAPVITQTSTAGTSPFTFSVAEDATYFPGYYWNAQSSSVSNFASTLSDVIQQIETGDLSGTDDIVLTGFATATSGAMYARLRVGVEDGAGGYTWGSWSNVLNDTIAVVAFAADETAAPNKVASVSAPYTFAAQAIGAAASSRYVLVLVDFLSDGGNLSGVTIGGVAATLLTRTINNGRGEAWMAAVPTGTTADVVIAAANFTHLGIKVWRLVGINTSPTIVINDVGYNAAPFSIAVTTPTGGKTIFSAGQGPTTGTPVWTNATGVSLVQNTGSSFFSAVRSTAGAATVSYTGFADYSADYLISLGFAPA